MGFFANLAAKITAKTAARTASKAAAKAGARTVAQMSGRTAARLGGGITSRLGLRSGMLIGAGGLFGLSNILGGDGPLGKVGDFLGLDNVSDTVSVLLWCVIAVVAVFILWKIFGRK